MPLHRLPALLPLALCLLAASGAALAEVQAPPAPALPPLALCSEGGPPDTDAPPGAAPCGGAAVVHPPPAAASSVGYVDCVSPGAGGDARCVAGGGGASVSARSVRDAASGQAPAAFPPADTAAVLAVCPDAPLLPDALGTAGNMDTAGLPTQGELDAAAGQVRAAGGEEGGGGVFSLFFVTPQPGPRSQPPLVSFFFLSPHPSPRSRPASPPYAPTRTPSPATTPAITPSGGRPPWPRPGPAWRPPPP